MTAPAPPTGAVSLPPQRPDLGEVARWHHADTLPYLEVRLYDVEGQRGFDMRTGPVNQRYLSIGDPAEADACMALLQAAREWVAAQPVLEPEPEVEAEPEPDPQLSIYDALEVPA